MPQLLTTMKNHISQIWKARALQSARLQRWLMPRRRFVPWVAGISVTVLLIGFAVGGGASWYEVHHEAIAPFLTLAAGVAVAGVALARHFAQTDADRQRRITESYGKAVEQLAHDKIEVRLGGIYTLERISRESPSDYWVILETITAFVRERARWNQPTKGAPETTQEAPPTDISAALSVILRRPDVERDREQQEGWRFNLTRTDLRGASLLDAHLERSRLGGAHLEGALLQRAHLERANLVGAHLEGASLGGANLSSANLMNANLTGAYLENTQLWNANLGGADLVGAQLEGTDLNEARGDAKTRLPDGVPRPAHWGQAVIAPE